MSNGFLTAPLVLQHRRGAFSFLPLRFAREEDGGRIFDVKHIIWYIVCVVVGNAIAFGVVAQALTVVFEGGDMNVSLLQGVYASVGNILVELVVGIPVIKLLANRNKSRTNLEKE